MNTFEFKWFGYHWTNKMEGGRIIHPDQPYQWYSMEENVFVPMRNDDLHLYCRYNPRKVEHEGKTYNPTYEVATMRSVEDFSYGTFSAEIMVPQGRNLSASFWLTGSGNWPPEIDIMESFLDNSGSWFKCFQKYFPWFSPGWTTTTNMHYRDEMMNKTHVGSRNIPYMKQHNDPSKEWIEYKCVWKPDSITYYANNKVVREIKGYQCKQMTKNLTDPKRGFRVNVVFNVWTENPDEYTIDMVQPMMVRNFKYTPYEKE